MNISTTCHDDIGVIYCRVTNDTDVKKIDNQYTGINFLWRNNSGTVEMVGVKPDDGDINNSLGNPKCE